MLQVFHLSNVVDDSILNHLRFIIKYFNKLRSGIPQLSPRLPQRIFVQVLCVFLEPLNKFSRHQYYGMPYRARLKGRGEFALILFLALPGCSLANSPAFLPISVVVDASASLPPFNMSASAIERPIGLSPILRPRALGGSTERPLSDRTRPLPLSRSPLHLSRPTTQRR